jgi:ADP-ribose pyrophosphatase
LSQPWQILARRTIYDSEWIRLHHLDIKLADGQVAHNWHLLDYPRQAAGIVPVGADGRILMIDQHRFTTGLRSWETPGGRIDEGETAVVAAHRELREETGHAAASMEFLGAYYPSSGSSNQVFNIFLAEGITRVGEISDTYEVIGLRWFTPAEVGEMIRKAEILDGMTLTGILWAFFRLGRGLP